MFPNTPKPNRSSIAFPGFPIPDRTVQAFPGFPTIGKLTATEIFNYLDGWNQSQIYEITIDSSLIDEDLENFPVLLKGENPTAEVADCCLEAYAIGEENPIHMGSAFDNNTSSGDASGAWYAYDSGYAITGWTGQDFGAGNGKRAYSYTVRSINSSDRTLDPLDWTFEASHTGAWAGEQIILDTVTGESFSGPVILKTYEVTPPEDTYRYYRINVTANNGNATYLVIQEIEIFHIGAPNIFADLLNALPDRTGEVLLIHSDETDGSVTFKDSSSLTNGITVIGSLHHETDQAKFGDTSMHFERTTSDALRIAHSFAVGALDFTIEFQIMRTSISTEQTICGQGPSSGATIDSGFVALRFESDNTIRSKFYIGDATNYMVYTAGTITDTDTWHHIAGVRSGDLWTLYIDGVADANTYDLTGKTLVPGSYDFAIGQHGERTGDRILDAYIDEFRIVKGVALYTENFTPPTRAYVEFTDAEILEKLAITDSSGNQLYTEVQEIDVANQLLIMWSKIPLVKTNQDTKVYLYYDETKPDIVGVTAKSVILDIADNWGDTYALGVRAVDFWYQGSKIEVAGTDISAYATTTRSGSFTADTTFNTSKSKIGGASGTGWQTDVTLTNQRLICVFNTPITFDEIVVNNYHTTGGETDRGAQNVVINISSNEITSTVYNETIANSTKLFDGVFVQHIAANQEHSHVVYKFNPTDEQTDATLLISSNNTDGDTVFHDTSFNGHSITAVADTHHEDTESKFGDTSIYFDGTGDYLSIPDSDDWYMDSDNFTLDFRIKRNRTSTREYICGQIDSGGTTVNSNLQIQIKSTDVLSIQQGYNATYFSWDTSVSISDTNWHHVALARNTNDYNLFIDGILEDTRDVTGYSFTNQSSMFSIGRTGAFASYYFQGYLDEFRIAKGICMWTEDFNPPLLPYAEAVPYNGVQNSLAGMKVWDDNFKAVYHMNQDPSGGTDCILDSTQNVNHGTPSGEMTSDDLIDGLTGKIIEFDGTNDVIDLGTTLTFSGDYSIDFMVWFNSYNVYNMLCGSPANTSDFIGYYHGGDGIHVRWAGAGNDVKFDVNLDLDKFYHITLTRKGSDHRLYIDGVDEGAGDSTSAGVVSITALANAYSANTWNLPGMLGTFVVADITRSAAWIKATNKSNRNLLLTIAKKV